MKTIQLITRDFLIPLENLEKTQIVDRTNFVKKVPPQTPEQLNTFDCGVFMLMFVKYLCMGKELSFSGEDMSKFREQIKEELLMG